MPEMSEEKARERDQCSRLNIQFIKIFVTHILRMFKFKVWLCKAIGDVQSTADESDKLRFYKQTKKNISEQNNHTNNYLPDRDNFT